MILWITQRIHTINQKHHISRLFYSKWTVSESPLSQYHASYFTKQLLLAQNSWLSSQISSKTNLTIF